MQVMYLLFYITLTIWSLLKILYTYRYHFKSFSYSKYHYEALITISCHASIFLTGWPNGHLRIARCGAPCESVHYWVSKSFFKCFVFSFAVLLTEVEVGHFDNKPEEKLSWLKQIKYVCSKINQVIWYIILTGPYDRA